MAKFFTWLFVVAKIVERLLPFFKRHVQDGTFANLRRKYKVAAKAARFIYHRGIGKGKRQGRQQERTHIARRMIKMGFDTPTICKATGLTRQEIEQLR